MIYYDVGIMFRLLDFGVFFVLYGSIRLLFILCVVCISIFLVENKKGFICMVDTLIFLIRNFISDSSFDGDFWI